MREFVSALKVNDSLEMQSKLNIKSAVGTREMAQQIRAPDARGEEHWSSSKNPLLV